MAPLVSILIPAYNAQAWIGHSLKSALGQDWERKEIVIVDDGSTDNTLRVARQFESPQVRIASQENQGAAAARNYAFSLCQGDYIQWLDADDLLAPGKISKQIRLADDAQILLSGSWGSFMYRTSRAQFRPTALWCDLSPAEWLVLKLGRNLYMQTATWLVSRQLTEAAGPWDTRLLGDDDGEYFCRVLLASAGTRFVEDSRVLYRATGASLSYIGRSDRKMDAQWLSMQKHVGYMTSVEDSERSRSACVTYLRNWSIFFHPHRPDLIAAVDGLARKLGGTLGVVEFPPKYKWIENCFGWQAARRAQIMLPSIKHCVRRTWDRILLELEDLHGGEGSATHVS